MCGINGVARAGGRRVDARVVTAMNAELVHRGPDHGGVADLGFAALGMRRLSVVDLAGGAQPMSAPDERHVLVYNGELYDHAALRAELEARGQRFRTSSDTEVLLNAWLADGERCVERLNGMFAFALLDRAERTLALVRDQLGVKPLYYHVSERGDLVFSSELSSLLVHPDVPRVLDRDSLAMLLVDRFVCAPWTLLQGVRQLPPGHLLTWRDGHVEVRPWFEHALAPVAVDEAEARRELQRTLDETVRSQLVADVPVGVFLSGGIDSSTVAAYAARAHGGPLKSFSVGFTDPEYDESPLAREVARHLGTEHHEVRMESGGFEPALLDDLVRHQGQPLADISCIPTWVVSRLAREEVTVVLSGDGGDELFGGYDHMFWAARVRRTADRTPALVRRFGRAVLSGLAPWTRGRIARAARRAIKGLELTFDDPVEQLRGLMCLWSEEDARRLVLDPPAHPLRRIMNTSDEELARLDPEEFAMVMLARIHLPSAILAKVDRMSMAASLEVRVPLLDARVVRFAQRLPLSLKVRGGTGKHLLREAGRELLPASVYRHRKQGFSLPLQDWLGDDFWDLLEELVRPGRPAAALFRRDALDAVVAEGRCARRQGHRTSSQAAASRAWLIALLARWMERYEVAA